MLFSCIVILMQISVIGVKSNGVLNWHISIHGLQLRHQETSKNILNIIPNVLQSKHFLGVKCQVRMIDDDREFCIKKSFHISSFLLFEYLYSVNLILFFERLFFLSTNNNIALCIVNNNHCS